MAKNLAIKAYEESTESTESTESVVENMSESEIDSALGIESTESTESAEHAEQSVLIELANMYCLSDSAMSKAIAELNLARADIKAAQDVLTIKRLNAELSLVVPALLQARVHRNLNQIGMVCNSALSGTVKNMLRHIFRNGLIVNRGVVSFKDATAGVSQSGKNRPDWNDGAFAFLVNVYQDTVLYGRNPISDSWKDMFPTPEKANAELLKAFNSNLERLTKKGIPLAVLQSAFAEFIREQTQGGNVV